MNHFYLFYKIFRVIKLKKTIFVILIVFNQSLWASAIGYGFLECSKSSKVPATLSGKPVCVLVVECLYGPLPEAYKEDRKWVTEKAYCSMNYCNYPLECIRDQSVSEKDMPFILDSNGKAIFPLEIEADSEKLNATPEAIR